MLWQDLEARLADINCDGWKLVVTGHSLGAGAAALVALYAHNYFPRWATYTASPQPCSTKRPESPLSPRRNACLQTTFAMQYRFWCM